MYHLAGLSKLNPPENFLKHLTTMWALERLRAYDLAAEEYRLAAAIEPDLKVEALRSADLCDGLQRAAEITTAPEASASLADRVPPTQMDQTRASNQYGHGLGAAVDRLQGGAT